MARAILTERQKEILRDPSSVSDSYYRSVVSKVRDKIDRLEEDLNFLDENHKDLAEQMQEAVCDGDSADDELSIQLNRETWKEINARREPGESLEDAISRIVKKSS